MLIVRDALPGAPAPAGLADLVARCSAADDHAPFEEHTLLTLNGSRRLPHARVEVSDGSALTGCAVLYEGLDGWIVEAAVDPGGRGRGLGRLLLEAVSAHVASHGGGPLRAWVHGHGPAQLALAQSAGAEVERRLLVLERSLVDLPQAQCREGTLLRPMDVTSDADRDAWLELSNAAFGDHPDNGNWSRADLDWRLDAPWTDGTRFPVLVDAFGLVAGVWTKVEPGSSDGELYVVAVHPRAQGQRLGRLVVTAALRQLAASGCSRALLYVDASNASAVALYRWAGFEAGVEHLCLAVQVPAGLSPRAAART